MRPGHISAERDGYATDNHASVAGTYESTGERPGFVSWEPGLLQEPVVVPEPTSAMLGLLGLNFVGRRWKK